MRTITAIAATTAMLFGTTVLAVANDTSHKSKTRHLQNMAPEAGYYNYAPGPGGYYRDRDNWSGGEVPNVDFSPGPDPYVGTPYDHVYPY